MVPCAMTEDGPCQGVYVWSPNFDDRGKEKINSEIYDSQPFDSR